MRSLFIFCFLISGLLSVAQSTSYSVRTGLTLSNQRWGSADRDILLAPHFALGIAANTSEKTSLFAEVGYHLKGSVLRINNLFDQNGMELPQNTFPAKFHNIGVLLGARSSLWEMDNMNSYYLVGLHGTYTVADTIELSFITSEFTKKFNYGLTAGAGIEFNIGKLMPFVEVHIVPDISPQVFVPPVVVRINGQNQDWPEQRIVNFAFQISVGLRLSPPDTEWEVLEE